MGSRNFTFCQGPCCQCPCPVRSRPFPWMFASSLCRDVRYTHVIYHDRLRMVYAHDDTNATPARCSRLDMLNVLLVGCIKALTLVQKTTSAHGSPYAGSAWPRRPLAEPPVAETIHTLYDTRARFITHLNTPCLHAFHHVLHCTSLHCTVRYCPVISFPCTSYTYTYTYAWCMMHGA